MEEKEVKDQSHINWYPGHMAKAHRLIREQLSLADIVIELRDARMPDASANPMLQELSVNKPVLIILNKADLADQKQNEEWKKHFENCLVLNSASDDLTKTVVKEVKRILADKLARAKARGIRKKALRAMVVGIPNVGKSTFINNIVKKKVAKTENRPGVTKNLQWIRINEDVELLDTPGVLWPKLDDQEKAKKLALLGSINDEILDKEELVLFGLRYIIEHYPGLIKERYGVDENSEDLLSEIAKEKKWLGTSNIPDLDKTVNLILKDIRSNKIGRITFEDA
ncbi:MAG: ribosome biogenesis GTPase YlqF [Erysipelotrichaceae bacterium]|nr:ribosome biogenesis GTPase YlqF [Erysipelotrichaceae bacterium]